MAVNRKTDSEINSGEVNEVNEVMIGKIMERVTEMMDKKLNEMQKKLTVLKKPGNFKLTTAEVIHIVAFVKM